MPCANTWRASSRLSPSGTGISGQALWSGSSLCGALPSVAHTPQAPVTWEACWLHQPSGQRKRISRLRPPSHWTAFPPCVVRPWQCRFVLLYLFYLVPWLQLTRKSPWEKLSDISEAFSGRKGSIRLQPPGIYRIFFCLERHGLLYIFCFNKFGAYLLIRFKYWKL